MQVVLGSAGSKATLDEILCRSPLDEIEIVDPDGKALAYVVPAAARNACSPEYFASLRRESAQRIAKMILKLGDHSRQPDLSVATFPIVSAIRVVIEKLSEAQFEGNAREILRQIRDSMMNGGWQKYRDRAALDVVGRGINTLATQAEVVPDDVERIRKSFLDVGLIPVRLVMGDLDEIDEDPC